MNDDRGHSLAEILVALTIFMVGSAAAVPALKAYIVDSKLVGAALIFKGTFRRARSIAVRSGAQTAIRFEERADGIYFALYSDGNYNGVLSREIRSGVDRLLEEAQRLDGGVSGVRVEVDPGLPKIPPGRGKIASSDPIRFGRSNMVSFSPLGTATPGTFYLASEGGQAGVRVTGTSARVRVMIWRGGGWRQR
jgi:hypothetical protein